VARRHAIGRRRAHGGAISSNIGYIFADQINAPRAVVNSQNNALLWSWFQTDPFGRVEPNNNPQGLGVYDFDMRLPGQVHDNETGLDHNNARDYDPAIARFVQSDPLGISAGVDTYAYALNSPLSGFDLTGLVNLNLYPPGSKIYAYEQLLPNVPGAFIVGGHGLPNTLIDGRTNTPLRADQLGEMIKSHPDYHPGDVIRLDSCYTGGSANGFAQALADYLGTTVRAPNNYVWIREDGGFPWVAPFNRALADQHRTDLAYVGEPDLKQQGYGYLFFYPHKK